MIKTLPIIILIVLLPPIYAYLQYLLLKNVTNKPHKWIWLIYLRIITRIFLIIGLLYYLWTVRFTNWGWILGLFVLINSLIISIIAIRKLKTPST